ncbi:7TM diverse intracellular signaling domain-containing protein [Ekhidna sp.]|uniref:7TM diverse intracellular signaling domain-containing protein n=1 Tax=Ekhidna sp. TaxID=2608089 RepID=UPI003CCB8199
MIKRLVFQPVFLLVFLFGLSAQQTILFQGGTENRINHHAQVYLSQDTINGQEAWNRIQSDLLGKLQEKINPGITTSAFWIHFQIKNLSEEELLYLEVDYAQLDYLQLYQVNNDSAKLLFETGDRYTFDKRPVQYRNFAFPLQLSQDSTSQYLLNIDKRLSAARFPLNLYANSSFWGMYNSETIFYGFCFGFLALVILISLIVGIRLKRSIFIWYSLYVLTFGLRCFAKLGYGYQFITSDYPNLNTHFFPLTTQFAMFFLILYVQNYFDTKETMPRFNKIMNGWLVLFVISTLIWALAPSFIVSTGPILISIRYAVVVSIIIFAYSSGINYLKIDAFKAQIFLVGYSLFFLGVLSQILIEYGVINSSLVPGDPLFAGFFFEVAVLSYAMIILLVKVINDKEGLVASNLRLKQMLESLEKQYKQEEPSYVILKSKAVVDPQRIRYIQSDDHYLEFHLDDKARPEVDRNKLSAILEVLPPQFVQIHRSTIVNLEYVKTIYGNYLLLKDGEELKLSRTYKSRLEDRLAK